MVKVYTLAETPVRWRCSGCRHKFSVTSGTIFHSRKLAIRDYLAVIALFCNRLKGVAALHMARDMNINPKSAFVLLQTRNCALRLRAQRKNNQRGGLPSRTRRGHGARQPVAAHSVVLIGLLFLQEQEERPRAEALCMRKGKKPRVDPLSPEASPIHSRRLAKWHAIIISSADACAAGRSPAAAGVTLLLKRSDE